jgi:hypothetical protein
MATDAKLSAKTLLSRASAADRLYIQDASGGVGRAITYQALMQDAFGMMEGGATFPLLAATDAALTVVPMTGGTATAYGSGVTWELGNNRALLAAGRYAFFGALSFSYFRTASANRCIVTLAPCLSGTPINIGTPLNIPAQAASWGGVPVATDSMGIATCQGVANVASDATPADLRVTFIASGGAGTIEVNSFGSSFVIIRLPNDS